MNLFDKLVLILIRQVGNVTVTPSEVFGIKHVHLGQWVFYENFDAVEIRSRDSSFRTNCGTEQDLRRILACLNFN